MDIRRVLPSVLLSEGRCLLPQHQFSLLRQAHPTRRPRDCGLCSRCVLCYQLTPDMVIHVGWSHMDFWAIEAEWVDACYQTDHNMVMYWTELARNWRRAFPEAAEWIGWGCARQ